MRVIKYACGCKEVRFEFQTCPIHSKPIISILNVNESHKSRVINSIIIMQNPIQSHVDKMESDQLTREENAYVN